MATREIVVGSAPARNASASSATGSYIRPLAIVTTLFFMWGFITSLNDILVPHLKSIFELSYTQAMLIQFAFFSAYFLFSVPWSKIVNTTRLSEDDGRRLTDDGAWRGIVCARGVCSLRSRCF